MGEAHDQAVDGSADCEEEDDEKGGRGKYEENLAGNGFRGRERKEGLLADHEHGAAEQEMDCC